MRRTHRSTEDQSSFLKECVKQNIHFGHFDLTSGGTSHYYIDAKPILLDSHTLRLIAMTMMGLIGSKHEVIVGVGISGALLVPSILSMSPRQMKGLIVRKKEKIHGMCSTIEGDSFIQNSDVVLIDDVLNRGSSLQFAIQALKDIRNCTVVQCVVLVDRSTSPIKGAPAIASIFKVKELIDPEDLGDG